MIVEGNEIDPRVKKKDNVLSRLRDKTTAWVHENFRKPILEHVKKP